jgi:hypothetical protein
VDDQLERMRRLGFLGDGEEGAVRTYRITREP